MITTDQQNRLEELRRAYENLQALTLDTDPISKIVEEALYKKSVEKREKEVARAEAVAELMVHFDFLEKRIHDLFNKYGVTMSKYPGYLKIFTNINWCCIVNTFEITASYTNGSFPFKGIQYRSFSKPYELINVNKCDINESTYYDILTELAKFLAEKIPANA